MAMFNVRVPGTSANVGPGFDSFGLCLSIYNTFIFRKSRNFKDNNLAYLAYRKTFEYLGLDLIPISIQIKSKVPSTRGLGSSSTCIVAGVYGALYTIYGKIDKDLALDIATEIEGHPDNVAPAIFGAFVVSLMEGGHIHYRRYELNENIEFLTCIPSFQLRTKDARGVLPKNIPLADGIHNVSRASLLIPALVEMDKKLIKTCLDDRFHQPYRKKLIRGYEDITKKAMEFGALGTYLSGAGPSIMVLAEKGSQTYMKFKGYAGVKYRSWEIKKLDLDLAGAKIIL